MGSDVIHDHSASSLCAGRGVSFSLLGQVGAADCDGRPRELGGRRPQAVLAMLLLDANRVVSCDRLIDGLWGERPPTGAANALQVFVSRLRAGLGDRDFAEGDRCLSTRRGGYLLRVDPERLDLLRVERLLADARAASERHDHAAARGCYRQAVAEWKGISLGGLGETPFAGVEIARLEELRRAAVEGALAASVELGAGEEVVPELTRLWEQDPCRERVVELLMRALYRCGRQADALATYETHYRRLDHELGLEPSPALRALQRAVLTQEPDLATPAAVPAPTPPAAPHRPTAAASTHSERPRSPRSRTVRWLATGLGCGAVALLAVALAFHSAARLHAPQATAARHTMPSALVMASRALDRIHQDEVGHARDLARISDDRSAAAAVRLVGERYTWRGETPTRGFDPSGLVRWVWRQQQLTLPHSIEAQFSVATGGWPMIRRVDRGPHIHYAKIRLGDLLFFDHASAVTVYVGAGYAVGVAPGEAYVRIFNLRTAGALVSHYRGANRVTLPLEMLKPAPRRAFLPIKRKQGIVARRALLTYPPAP